MCECGNVYGFRYIERVGYYIDNKLNKITGMCQETYTFHQHIKVHVIDE